MSSDVTHLSVLILCPDQLRADYLSCYGHPSIETANIDRLAEQGIRFDRAYCAAPLCGPSRISFVTSTRLSEHGHRNYGSTIDYAVPNLVSVLQGSGYRTGMFGKNHCFNPDQLKSIWDSIDEVFLGNYDEHPKYRRSFDAFELEADHKYNVTRRLAEETMDFIRKVPKDQPYLAWVNWQDPHPAFTCPEPYFSMFDRNAVKLPALPETWDRKPRRLVNWRINSQADEATEDDIRAARAAYMGQIRYVDDCVGSMLDALAETGRDRDTLVIFFSDHGELLGDQGAFHKIPVFYECLTRIPFIMRHPQGLYRGVVEGLVEEVDLSPTILEACGFRSPLTFVGESLHQRIVDGKTGFDDGRPTAIVEAGLQAPTWPGAFHEKQKAPFAPNNFGPGAMITDGRYKLSVYFDDICELYDLATDPNELDNRFEDTILAEVRERLMMELCRRLLGAGVRDVGGVRWPDGYNSDPRQMPLEAAAVRHGTAGSGM